MERLTDNVLCSDREGVLLGRLELPLRDRATVGFSREVVLGLNGMRPVILLVRQRWCESSSDRGKLGLRDSLGGDDSVGVSVGLVV